MTFTNAIARLERAGFSVKLSDSVRSTFEPYGVLPPFAIYARKNGRVITCYRNGERDLVATINARSESDHDEPQSDYFAGSYYRNLAQAMRSAERS
jgi:hypothetical protein